MSKATTPPYFDLVTAINPLSRKQVPEELKGFIFEKNLGRGSFGLVRLYIHEKSGNRYAIKFCEKKGRGNAKQEMISLQQVTHPNVVRVFPEFQINHQNYDCFVMEYCEQGNLYERIRQGIPLEECLQFMKQLALGLRALHKSNIVHRDIKANNILLNSTAGGKLIIKISDFGLAKMTNDSGTSSSTKGHWRYRAPEVRNAEAKFTQKSDVFSLGCVFFEMMNNDLTDVDYAFIPEEKFEECELGMLSDLVKQMLDHDPSKRPSSAEICKKLNEIIEVYQDPVGHLEELCMANKLEMITWPSSNSNGSKVKIRVFGKEYQLIATKRFPELEIAKKQAALQMLRYLKENPID